MKEQTQSVRTYLQVGLRLLLICLCAALLLAGVHRLTADRITRQQQEKLTLALQTIFSQAERIESIEPVPDSVQAVYAVYEGETLLGYCVQVKSNGYGGEMELLIGYTKSAVLTRIAVLSHAETKGIGSKVVANEDYLASYIGTPASSEKEMDGVSGATLSSNGVHTAVLTAGRALLEVIA